MLILLVFTVFKRTIIIDSIICFLYASMNPPTAITLSPSDLESKSQPIDLGSALSAKYLQYSKEQ